jgi:hypothetical protein
MCIAGDELRSSGPIGSNVNLVCFFLRADLRARFEGIVKVYQGVVWRLKGEDELRGV